MNQTSKLDSVLILTVTVIVSVLYIICLFIFMFLLKPIWSLIKALFSPMSGGYPKEIRDAMGLPFL